MEKYKELFNSARYVLDEEQKRFVRIDEKASKYISVLIVLFGLLGFIFKWSFDAFIPFQSPIDYVGVCVFSCLILFLALAFFLCFKVLKTAQIRAMPMNDKMIKFYRENKLIDIYFALAKKFMDAFQVNSKIVVQKGILLSWGYKFIVYSFISLLLLLPLMGIRMYERKIIKKEVISMLEEEKDETQNSETSDSGERETNRQEPDDSVEAPDFNWRTEGYKPEKEKKKNKDK